MNYWERHIGDYARDTAHLSMLEHGAYTLLLDRYYATEKPIPADQVHRLTRARTREEKSAVDAVLQEFFQLEDGCWQHGRCDAVIAKYQDGEPAREGKRKNAAERQRRARERREEIFKELASHGIYPDWNATTAELKTHLERVKSQPVTQPVTRDVTATHTQTPDPINNSLSPAHDDRLNLPGLSNYHSEHWQPDRTKLATLLQRAGIPMPDDQALANSLTRFNLNFHGKSLTESETYSRLVTWLTGDHNRNGNRSPIAVIPAAGSRRLTAVERVDQACAAELERIHAEGDY